jgi:magnesium chelatase family protein
MITKLSSAALQGVDAVEVQVEVNSPGIGTPRMVIVGLPDAAVRESAERVTSALYASALSMEDGVITVNLAPADLKKEGPSFDLPIALAVAAGGDRSGLPEADDCQVVGELALDGTVRPVKGVLSVALEAKARGKRRLLVPEENAREAAVVSGIEVFGIRHLKQAWDFLGGLEPLNPASANGNGTEENSISYAIDLDEVKGQHHVKRALEVAAAGSHNLLMVGPPGTGKSMLAKRIPTILPDLSEEEAIETTRVHSIAGTLDPKAGLLRTRPYRAPHHTISDAGLLGGGSNPGPGEISLAHNGVLFLDELPEFRRQTLEVLRQPIEDGQVTISRAAGSLTFPANVLLVGSLNPCPCGFYGDARRDCRCSPRQIEQYRHKISGPLLDRIDLHVEVPIVDYKQLSSNERSENSATVRGRVKHCRERQAGRFKGIAGVRVNSDMGPRQVRKQCELDCESSQILEQAMEHLNFSARAYDRILKVARTISDLAGSERIETTHLLEAIQYRSLDRKLIL